MAQSVENSYIGWWSKKNCNENNDEEKIIKKCECTKTYCSNRKITKKLSGEPFTSGQN